MPNPDLIPEPFAQSGDKNPIPLERAISDPIYRASWKAGFPPDTRLPKDLGGEAPDGLDFNGVLNILSQAVVFLQKGNAYQFDASLAPYPIGALVRSNDNLTTYQSTVPNNSNNPNINMTGWRVYNGSGLIVDNLTTNDSTKALSAAQGKVLQDKKLEASGVGVANGVASLDANTKVPIVQLPNASTTAIGAVQLNNTLTSTSSTQALTAAQGKAVNDRFTNDFTNLKAGNGYQKLPGGLILQWGVGSTSVNTVFPLVFPNAVSSIALAIQAGSSRADNIFYNQLTKSGFTSWGRTPDGGEATLGFTYIVIGY